LSHHEPKPNETVEGSNKASDGNIPHRCPEVKRFAPSSTVIY